MIRFLLLVSLLLNVALVIALGLGVAEKGVADSGSSREAAAIAPAKTAPAAEEIWSKLKSDDMASLVAHLRAAGLPPEVVRAILVAQLREQFAARRKALEGDTTKRPFWKNATADPKLQIALRQLSVEEQKAIRDLLGQDAESSDNIGQMYRERGLAAVSPEKADQVRQILRDYDQQRQDLYMQLSNGGPITIGTNERAKLTAIDKAQHEELAKVLTPTELENYDLVSSNTAQSLRYQLSAFNPTEDEFRALYRIQSQFADRLNSSSDLTTADDMRARSETQKDLNAQIQLTLGADRFAEYQRATDYNYRQTAQLLARLELPAEMANQLYTIQKQYQQLRTDAMRDAASTDERNQRLAALQQEAIAKVSPLLGSDRAVEAYKQYGGSWITNMVPRSRAVSPATPIIAPKS